MAQDLNSFPAVCGWTPGLRHTSIAHHIEPLTGCCSARRGRAAAAGVQRAAKANSIAKRRRHAARRCSLEYRSPFEFIWPARRKPCPATLRYRTEVCCLQFGGVLDAHSTAVSLRGASEMTSSFLKFAVNSILYNRQVFPKQSFASAQRFGCEVHVTKDEWLEKYLTKFFGQV